ncbi:Methyltransferase domain-containing protein [Mariprofundus ferrinatatus]|uniref:Methyltransferase domain-containing protein n=1 Tax=Mariprofundus ferrinatatus TaxID=1921087 RepID=A0A2K8LAT4_9PROT|nr:class I SAM-dependent methyltransferase [Mariprofundus ferrinatatus]ATX82054.1 Methyltransferase domain-containing protein [Mariprofundus ferrinatatus]
MAQNTSGIRAIFSHASVYNIAQRLVGAEKARTILVKDYFPKSESYRMLDIGCGTAEILRHLPYDLDYVGFDASATYITEACRQFGNRGTFKAELVREAILDQMQPFDLVLAFGLLHHLDDKEGETLFSLARQALKPGGKLITVDPVYVPDQRSLARWIISKDRGQNIRTAEAYQELALSHFTDIKVTVRHDMLHIPYSHLILECRK